MMHLASDLAALSYALSNKGLTIVLVVFRHLHKASAYCPGAALLYNPRVLQHATVLAPARARHVYTLQGLGEGRAGGGADE